MEVTGKQSWGKDLASSALWAIDSIYQQFRNEEFETDSEIFLDQEVFGVEASQSRRAGIQMS